MTKTESTIIGFLSTFWRVLNKFTFHSSTREDWILALQTTVYWKREKLLAKFRICTPPPRVEVSEEEIEKILVFDQAETKVTVQEREAIATNLANHNRKQIPTRFLGRVDKEILCRLKRQGIVKMPELDLDEKKVSEIRSFLDTRPVYNAHVAAHSDGIPRRLGEDAKTAPFGSYAMSDTIRCPHLLELALSPQVLGLVEGYLGCPPTLFSIHSWWSFPRHKEAGPQDFHRDIDDFKFVALFIYLTDIEGGENGGQHEFICSTHRVDMVKSQLEEGDDAEKYFYPLLQNNGYGSGSEYRKKFEPRIYSVTGKRGSVFLADTFALHRGVAPRKDDRLVCWIRFGLRKNLAYVQDKHEPIENFNWRERGLTADEYLKFVTRLIFK